eukprot:GEMP01022321.1.p1 GENE.GEMP01022321.1~~GEMP01022321.1.p1  ORF type:complete len:665 (+),score=195.48 GEMP01022321.1:147-2141(+)
MEFVLPWELRGLTLPGSRKQHLIIEHTVSFVLQNGDQSEVRLRMDPAASKKIPFIDINHELNPYYQWLKATKACLEDRAPQLLPEGWTFWREEKKRTEVKQKEEESTARLDGLLGHYDEDDSPKANKKLDAAGKKHHASSTGKKSAQKRDDRSPRAKAVTDLKALLGDYGEEDVDPPLPAPSSAPAPAYPVAVLASPYSEAVTSPPAPASYHHHAATSSTPVAGAVDASHLYLAAVSSPPGPDSCFPAVGTPSTPASHGSADVSHLYATAVSSPPACSSTHHPPTPQSRAIGSHPAHAPASASSAGILPGFMTVPDPGPATHAHNNTRAPSLPAPDDVDGMPLSSTPVDAEQAGAKRAVATGSTSRAKKNKIAMVFKASAQSSHSRGGKKVAEIKTMDVDMDADNLLHSLLEYAENADIDEAVMTGKLVGAASTMPTPSTASTDDGRGSKAENKNETKTEVPSGDSGRNLFCALGAYSDSDSDGEGARKSATPWPKPSAKLKPDRIAFILDIGVLLLRQHLAVVKLAKKVTWQEFSFLRGEEGAYFKQVVDVCVTKIENGEHKDVEEKPVPNSLVGFFGKLVMAQQKVVEKNSHAHVKPAGKVSLLADDKQRKVEERRQRALKLLRDKEQAEQRQKQLESGHEEDPLEALKRLSSEISRLTNGA